MRTRMKLKRENESEQERHVIIAIKIIYVICYFDYKTVTFSSSYKPLK